MDGDINLGLAESVRFRHLVEVFDFFFLPPESDAFGIRYSFSVIIIHYWPSNLAFSVTGA